MRLPENDYQILRLTNLFYQQYPNPPHKEILKKQKRAYNCLLFQTHYNFFICIPYRSEITHSFAYLFKKSNRSKKHKSGLDYTKILIVNKTEYLNNKDAIIDKDEYKEIWFFNIKIFSQRIGINKVVLWLCFLTITYLICIIYKRIIRRRFNLC